MVARLQRRLGDVNEPTVRPGVHVPGGAVCDPRPVVSKALNEPQAGQPRSADDAKTLRRFEHRMTLPLVLSAVLPLVLMPGSQRGALVVVVNVVAWLVFVADLVVHRRHVVRYLSTWVGRFDLGVVVLTAPWFLVFGTGGGKLILLIRFARLARLILAAPDARRLVKRIGRVGIVAIGVVVLGAVAAYEIEHPTNPQFASLGDSLWWSIVTLTTVGYGDIVPITAEGRLVGVMIMVAGVGVLGVLAGSLASFFRIAPESDLNSTPSDGHAEALRREVLDLRTQVERLNDGIARLLVQDGMSEGPGETSS